MPRELLDLPDEVLDDCLGELLPPLASVHHPTHLGRALLRRHQPPRDLCSLTAVCKTLHRLALPWVWRRVNIYVGDEALDPNHVTKPLQLAPLFSYPELAIHTRVLFLDLESAEVEEAVSLITMLLPAFRLMNNIRVVHCEFSLDYRHTIVDEIYAEIVSKPFLHTLISSYLPDTRETSSLLSLCRLNCISFEQDGLLESLLQMAPNLESLAISEDNLDISMLLHIPWGTLRQIELDHTKNWFYILPSFVWFFNRVSDAYPPLEEISIHSGADSDDESFGPGMSHDEIHDILVTFAGLPIRTLSLAGILNVDASDLDGIIDSFPELQELVLFSGEWDVDLTTITRKLRKLPKLKYICWNYHDEGTASRDILHALVKRCRALECVKFYSDMTRWRRYSIKRIKTEGGYQLFSASLEGVDSKSDVFTSTSCWDAWRYNRA